MQTHYTIHHDLEVCRSFGVSCETPRRLLRVSCGTPKRFGVSCRTLRRFAADWNVLPCVLSSFAQSGASQNVSPSLGRMKCWNASSSLWNTCIFPVCKNKMYCMACICDIFLCFRFQVFTAFGYGLERLSKHRRDQLVQNSGLECWPIA